MNSLEEMGLDSKLRAIGGIPNRIHDGDMRQTQPYEFSSKVEPQAKSINLSEANIVDFIRRDTSWVSAAGDFDTNESLEISGYIAALGNEKVMGQPTTYIYLGTPGDFDNADADFKIFPDAGGSINPFDFNFWGGYTSYPGENICAYSLIANNVDYGTTDLVVFQTWSYIKSQSRVYEIYPNL